MAKPGRQSRKRRNPRPDAARSGDAPSLTDARGGTRELLVVIALLVVSIAAVYAPVLGHEFVSLDDPEYFLRNPHLDGQLGFDDVRSAFADPYFANWIPVTSLSIAFDHALYGSAPRGYLVTNAWLHALASIFLFLALRRMTGEWLPSACVAAIFALHPLHVESVAWASQRKDVLFGVFWMATLFVYAGYVKRPGAARYAAVVGLVALALLSKPAAVTLPLALLLLDLWPLRRIVDFDRRSLIPGWQRTLLEKLPLLVLAAIASAVAVEVQRSAGAIRAEDVPFGTRVGNAWLAYVDYLRDSFWPRGLAVSYPYSAARLVSAEPYVALGILSVVTALCVWLVRRRPALLVGWLWFLGTLVPMIGLVQVGGQARADRYMYVPQIGLSIALVWGALDGLRLGTRARSAVLAGVALSLLALGVVAHAQVRTWRTSVSLFEHAIAVVEDNVLAHDSLGSLLLDRNDLDGAERHLREALRIQPRFGNVRVRLGLCLARRGRIDEGRREIARALADAARPAQAHAALGIAADLEKSTARAIEEYREALRFDPQHFEAVNNLAWLLATSKDPGLRDPAGALELAESMRAIRSPDALSLDTLAAAYAAVGRFDDAVRTQELALRALGASGDGAAEAEYQARLSAYREGRVAD